MELILNQVYHGFVLKEEIWIEDIASFVYRFEHENNGARLLFVKNEDKNKVFSVSFKTPPTDHTGIAHILEHSVLCGSRKYQAKDPFNELAKGSLNTYLNAMTFADKTMYPIASCNEEDFHNLMDVYLDAVFYPNIYDKKEIFLQEGYRYFFDETGKLNITGVVYNEMKGALSDPESLLSLEITKLFYKNTTYGFESGGDPKYIPDLTYEDFLKFHQEYYHPSNAYLYLYGDLDFERALAHINENYISQFEKLDSLPKIDIQKIVPENFIQKATYTAQTEDEDERGYLSYTFNVGTNLNAQHTMALQILSYCLLETNASPLKQNLLNAGICNEVEGWFDTSTLEMIFSIVAKDADVSRVVEFETIVKETLQDITENGMNQKLLRACLKRVEFLLKEDESGSTPKGLLYNIRALKTWLHGESPYIYLQQIQTLLSLKEESFVWEDFLRDVFLNHAMQNILIFTPEQGKAKKEQEAFLNWLSEKEKVLSETDKKMIEADLKALELFQTQEDTEEILNQIPILKLSQVDTKPQIVEKEISDMKLDDVTNQGAEELEKEIFVPLASKDIVYLKMHFNMKGFAKEELSACALLIEVLGRLGTKSYSYETLPLITNEVVGALNFQNDIYAKDIHNYTTFVTLKSKFLLEDMDKAKDLFEEILFHTQFDALVDLKKLIKASKIAGENYLLSSPHLLAIYHSNQTTSTANMIQEHMKGISYIHFLYDIDKRLGENPEEVIQLLQHTAKRLFCKENVAISLGCDASYKEEVMKSLYTFCDSMPSGAKERVSLAVESINIKTAFYAPMQVQYNVLSGNYQEVGGTYCGSLEVLKTILDLEFLWNQVRVKGGAYGAGSSFKRSGLFFFYSYRDPNVKQTYDIYQQLHQSISNFEPSEKEMTKYILGTINRFDQPKSNTELLAEAIFHTYSNWSEEDIQNQRLEILKTTQKEIGGYANLLEKMMNNHHKTSIGNEQALEQNKDLFEVMKPLIPSNQTYIQ